MSVARDLIIGSHIVQLDLLFVTECKVVDFVVKERRRAVLMRVEFHSLRSSCDMEVGTNQIPGIRLTHRLLVSKA